MGFSEVRCLVGGIGWWELEARIEISLSEGFYRVGVVLMSESCSQVVLSMFQVGFRIFC